MYLVQLLGRFWLVDDDKQVLDCFDVGSGGEVEKRVRAFYGESPVSTCGVGWLEDIVTKHIRNQRGSICLTKSGGYVLGC